MSRHATPTKLPTEHLSAVLSDCATPDGSISGALLGLGYDSDAAGQVTLDVLRAAYRLDPERLSPMDRAERVARALVLAGYA